MTSPLSGARVNCIKTLALLKWLAYASATVTIAINDEQREEWWMAMESLYASHLRSANVFIQLTHSMLPLSILILGCYTCSIYRWSLDIAGTSIATYEGYMSRDNGNIECTSSEDDVSSIATHTLALEMQSNVATTSNDDLLLEQDWWYDTVATKTETAMDEDLYSHQYGLETIKTISNTGSTKNIIIPLINGTGTIFPVMIIFCIRDSLREYKSKYDILSNLKISLYNWTITSESAIFLILAALAYQVILSPTYLTINLWIVNIQLNSDDLSLKNTNLLSASAIWIVFQYNTDTGLGLILIYLYSLYFMECQVYEFAGLAINMNEHT